MKEKDALRRATAFNNTHVRFKEKYGHKYAASVAKVVGSEKSDRNVYYNVGFTVRDQVQSDDSFEGFEEFTLDPSIKKVMDRLHSRIKNIKKSMSNHKGNDVVYQEKIDSLEIQIERLEDQNSLAEMSSVANDHLTWVTNILDQKKVSISELTEAQNSINVWRDAKVLFRDDYSGKYKEVLADIAGRAEDLEAKWKDVALQVMHKEAQASSKRAVHESDFKVMTDINAVVANLRDLSEIDNPATQALDNWLKDAARDTNTEFTDISRQITEAYDKLKETAEYQANKFDVFLQKDSSGKWTGSLTHRYSQAWYDEAKARGKKRDRNKDKPESHKAYFEWRKENELIVDSRVLFDEEGKHVTDSAGYKNHIKELEKEFGEVRAAEMVAQAEEKYMLYLTDLAAFEASLEADMLLDSTMTQETSDAKLLNWKVKNSPKNYLSSYKGQAVMKGVKLEGYKYTVAKPRKTINGVATKWYDKSYEKIENDPALLEFYNFYRDTMASGLNSLPTHEVRDQQANFMPHVQKTIIEKYISTGFRGARTGIWENFTDALSTQERGAVSADRDMRTGNINQRIPVRFLQDTDVSDKSTNMIKALEMFTLMSLNHKHKSKVEDKSLIMQRIVNEAIEQKLNSRSGIHKDTEGNLFQTTDGLVNLKKVVAHTINYSLYDNRREEGAPTGVVLTGNVKDSVKATKLSAKISKINTQYKLGKITEEQHTAQTEPLQIELDELGGKNITTVDIADFTMKFTQLKGMAYNVFSASNNITFGLISNIMHAAGGEDFSIKEAATAYRMMLASTSKSLGLDRAGVASDSAKKINALMEKFDVLAEVDEAAYNGKRRTKSSQLLAKFSPYEMQRRSEYFVQGQNMVARMLNEKVKTSEGVETTLFEAFDDNGDWKTDVYGENPGWDGSIDNEGDMGDFRTFRNRLIQLNKRIHGNYDPNSFPMAKRVMMGRFASQFKSWFAEAVALRFEPQRWDDQLGRNVKGMYRTIGQIGAMETLRSYLKIGIGKKDGLSHLSPIDQANLRKSFTELAFIVAINIMALTVLGLSDDDDDKNERTLILNQLYRLESDLTFFMSPSSFDRVLSNPVAAIRTYTDLEKAFMHSARYIMEDGETDGRKNLEGDDVFNKIMKAFPITNQPGKIHTQIDKVFSN